MKMLIRFENINLIENKEVKAQKKSGVIYLPMKYIGKKVIILIENENKRTDNPDDELLR